MKIQDLFRYKFSLIAVLTILLLTGPTASAQTTSFSYQGRLADGAAGANGTYQFQFKLFDAATGGNQIGATIADVNANVTNGSFAVQLDFGATAFNGGERYLEVSVRRSPVDFYTLLTPRDRVASAPYAVRSNSTLNFTGSLAGDVTGTQNATVVNSVGGQSASAIAGSVQATSAATNANTPNTIVKRDATGKIAVGGVQFSDGTTLTSANPGTLLGSNNVWTGANTFSNGLSANNSLITNVGNPVNAGDAANKAYTDANFVKFVPGAEQLSVGDANGTAPMINLRGGSTCCSGPGGHTPAFFKVFQNGSFVATGNLGIGTSPMEGKGYRTSWHTYKGAFRSGYADNEWDDANVGFFSWAGGSNSTASGLYALAFGDTNSAESTSSIVFGSGNQVKGAAGFSAGAGNRSATLTASRSAITPNQADHTLTANATPNLSTFAGLPPSPSVTTSPPIRITRPQWANSPRITVFRALSSGATVRRRRAPTLSETRRITNLRRGRRAVFVSARIWAARRAAIFPPVRAFSTALRAARPKKISFPSAAQTF